MHDGGLTLNPQILHLLPHVELHDAGEDVVDAALFLCSEHAQYITGQVLHVNGGFYM